MIKLSDSIFVPRGLHKNDDAGKTGEGFLVIISLHAKTSRRNKFAHPNPDSLN